MYSRNNLDPNKAAVERMHPANGSGGVRSGAGTPSVAPTLPGGHGPSSADLTRANSMTNMPYASAPVPSGTFHPQTQPAVGQRGDLESSASALLMSMSRSSVAPTPTGLSLAAAEGRPASAYPSGGSNNAQHQEGGGASLTLAGPLSPSSTRGTPLLQHGPQSSTSNKAEGAYNAAFPHMDGGANSSQTYPMVGIGGSGASPSSASTSNYLGPSSSPSSVPNNAASSSSPQTTTANTNAFSSRYHTAAQLRETAMEAISDSVDGALRAEVKRMREEVIRLRKEAHRAAQLQDEVKFLRNVTLLQHEEKVPIRLRELERDNLSLKRQVAALEEKLRTYENDEYRQRLGLQTSVLMSGGGLLGAGGGMMGGGLAGGGSSQGERGGGAVGFSMDFADTTTSFAADGGRRQGSMYNPRKRATSISPTGAGRRFVGAGGGAFTGSFGGASSSTINNEHGGGGGHGGNANIIIKQSDSTDSCGSCRLKISAMERVTRADKKELQEALAVTQSRLDEANKELTAIQNWVKSVVANAHQFPQIASQQPTLDRVSSFASPVGVASTRDRQLDPRSALGNAYFNQYADPHARAQSGLTWSSSIAPQTSYLEARRR